MHKITMLRQVLSKSLTWALLLSLLTTAFLASLKPLPFKQDAVKTFVHAHILSFTQDTITSIANGLRFGKPKVKAADYKISIYNKAVPAKEIIRYTYFQKQFSVFVDFAELLAITFIASFFITIAIITLFLARIGKLQSENITQGTHIGK